MSDQKDENLSANLVIYEDSERKVISAHETATDAHAAFEKEATKRKMLLQPLVPGFVAVSEDGQSRLTIED